MGGSPVPFNLANECLLPSGLLETALNCVSAKVVVRPGDRPVLLPVGPLGYRPQAWYARGDPLHPKSPGNFYKACTTGSETVDLGGEWKFICVAAARRVGRGVSWVW